MSLRDNKGISRVVCNYGIMHFGILRSSTLQLYVYFAFLIFSLCVESNKGVLALIVLYAIHKK